MFWTHRRAEVSTHAHFGYETQAWTHVSQSLHVPWFYVTVTEGSHGETLLTMLLVQEVSVLEALLAQQNGSMKVESVQLVSPGQINNSGRWLMEPLIELSRITSSEGLTYSFVVEGGMQYLDRMDTSIHAAGSLGSVIYRAIYDAK